jgi:galactonate dehydratase
VCDLLEKVMDPERFRFRDGYAVASTRPGLGVDIDEKAVRHAAETGHSWRNPVWRGPDGAFTEW